MSTNVSAVVKHFASAQGGFNTTLASTISAGATTVPLNDLSGYNNGEVAVFIVAPSTASEKQIFTGTVDTAGVQLTSVKWLSGSNQTHNAGTQVVDYVSSAHQSMMSKGILVEHGQDGKHTNVTATSVTATTGTFTSLTVGGAATSQGWTALGQTPNTMTYNGNRNYDLVFNSVDLTGTLSPGMKMQMVRNTAAPTQCTSLNGTTQYFNKTSPSGMTFTGNFSCSAWVKLSSYPSAQAGIIGRDSAGGTLSGWEFGITTDGRVQLYWRNASGNSSCNSYASIPLNKWVHIAAVATVATPTAAIYIDGVLVSSSMAATAATTVVQASTNLTIGNRNSTSGFFPGKLAQVAVFSAAISQATLQSYISQGMSGSEANLISAFSLSNSLNDLNTSNANNLTAQASATTTNSDSPFGNGGVSSTLEYAEVNAISFSTNTTVNVRVPETCMIPTTGTITTVNYSTQSNPYGLPYFSKIIAQAIIRGIFSTTTTGSWVDVSGLTTTAYIPTGAKAKVRFYASRFSMSAGGASNMAVRESSYIWASALRNFAGSVDFGSAIAENTISLSPGNHTFVASVASNAASTLTLTPAGTSAVTDTGDHILTVEIA